MYDERDMIEIDLLQLLAEIRKHIIMVILITLIGGAAAAAYANFVLKPVYRSTSKLYMLSQSISVASIADLQLGTVLTHDFEIMIKSRPVLSQVAKNLDLDYGYGALQGMITIENPENTRILNISVSCGDPDQAAEIANEVAKVSKRQISDIMSTDEPILFETAIPIDSPIAPNKRNIILMGLLIGFAIACALVWIRYLLNDSIKNELELERVLDLNVLASIPNEKPHRLRAIQNAKIEDAEDKK